ncbi:MULTISPECIES: hypothetical protein [Sphingomonadaceae]|jgi:hypothetical protein|uniref:hypothetical protein n=1 Tax=Sphingomonadales TaxID=204457 RepID=UPI0018016E29|nr:MULTISPECIES: hypothetical protein [Sphingomonadaceae]MBA4762661.1 hypothetical protein [Sphingomonas sp.]MBS0503010.1 hypothetical protein [Pseudomonadota bacterium]CAH0355403.1 hypothetical protein SPH9361_03481 [Sphingobium sp. CECT 9361]|tara:strand:+ start:19059 stop:20036 length:978 start_codon:yes stop_codon:yes gene_type:complete
MRFDRRAVIASLGAVAIGGTSLAGAIATPSYEDPDDMYAALGRQPQQVLRIGGGTIRVVFADGAPGLVRDPVLAWIQTAAVAVTAYFGRFPVEDFGLLIIADSSDKVGHATTFGYAGSATRIHVGTGATSTAFRNDWVLVHEMVHTALPDLPRRALWLQEGNATYVEPIARVMAGQIPAADVWRQLVTGLPKGSPQPADGGMDGTRAWGRLYWGGAAFWLLAEIAIYRDTMGKRSLRDALRRINRASGGNTMDWSPEQLMTAGDQAIGANSLIDLYTRFADTRVVPDLPDLFRQLGIIQLGDGAISFDSHAQLAELRRTVTLPPR